jgi:hypothetical protein
MWCRRQAGPEGQLPLFGASMLVARLLAHAGPVATAWIDRCGYAPMWIPSVFCSTNEQTHTHQKTGLSGQQFESQA